MYVSLTISAHRGEGLVYFLKAGLSLRTIGNNSWQTQIDHELCVAVNTDFKQLQESFFDVKCGVPGELKQ